VEENGGGGEWRRRRSGGRGRRGRGREASGLCGEARCGANWGRGGSGRGAPRRAGGSGGRRSSAVVLRLKFDGVKGLVSTSRSWGSLLEDRWEQWAIGGGCPRRPVVHRKGGAGGGAYRGFGVHTARGKEVEMDQV
jgi:hypothetical protein